MTPPPSAEPAPPTDLMALVESQAGDEGLWFIDRRTVREAYLQQNLRLLHEAVEAVGLAARYHLSAAKAEERIGMLETLSRSYLAFVEHVGDCDDCLMTYTSDHAQIPDAAEARALLGEAPNAKAE